MEQTSSAFNADAEGALGSGGISSSDPFLIRGGIVPDDDIAGLRHRKKGKSVARYQAEQNDVCVLHVHSSNQVLTINFSLSKIF